MSSTEIGGYCCTFIDQVFGDYYCKKCNLVARRLSVTSCCGEHYCHGCISVDILDHRPCPECGTDSFNIVELVKLQRRIACLLVHCVMKERGCKWSGTLEELDTHIHPDLENCQYIDTTCPLNCQQPVPRNKLNDHLSEECVKRNYFCQFCSFSATYEEIVNVHMPKCSYVPLQCPNMCGVSGEREMMENHVKTCRLEKASCQFNVVGCHEEFKRQDQESHVKENVQKHLLLTATTLSQRIQDQKITIQKKMEESQGKTKVEFEEMKHKLQECTESLTSQSHIINEQGNLLRDCKKKLEDKDQEIEQERVAYQRKMEEQAQVFKCRLEEQELKFGSREEEWKLHLQEQQQRLQQKFESQQRTLKSEVGQLTQKLQECHKKFDSIDKLAHQLEDYKKKLEESGRTRTQELTTYNKKLEDQDRAYRQKMEEYQTKLESQEKKLKELEELVQAHPYPPHPPPPHWHHPPPHPHRHGRRGHHGGWGPP